MNGMASKAPRVLRNRRARDRCRRRDAWSTVRSLLYPPCIVLLLVPSFAHAAELNWGEQEAFAAVDDLISTVLDNCEYEFAARKTITSVNLDYSVTGRYGFYRCADTIIIDRQLKTLGPGNSNIPSCQFIKRPSHPFIEVEYSQGPPVTQHSGDPKKRFLIAGCDDRLSSAEMFTVSLNHIELGHLLGKFASTDLSLRQLATQSLQDVRVENDGQHIVASHRSRFGKVVIGYSFVHNRFRVTSLALKQSPTDILNRRFDRTLRSVTEFGSLPVDPEGIKSGAVTATIRYDIGASGDVFIKEYSVIEEYSNGRGNWRAEHHLDCLRHRKQTSAAALERLAVAIPNGQEILSPSSWPVRRMWSDGQIVRHSDDTALRIAARLAMSRRVWYFLSPLVLLLACGAYFVLRWRRRSRQPAAH